jgi:glycerophosphoryl diester phosphodiesterase
MLYNLRVKQKHTELFYQRFCPHRGIGEENTLASITAGVRTQPFLVEFDVQWINDNHYLGHPPVKKTDETLSEALQIYTGKSTMPKVDLKLTPESSRQAITALCSTLSETPVNRILVNISGKVDARDYMHAEQLLVRNTPNNVMLNIDLGRYAGISMPDIENHIYTPMRKPFSLSPNLDDDLDEALDFALNHSIPQVHFWSHEDKQYDIDRLFGILTATEEKGLTCYFDVKEQNIINHEIAAMPA